MSKVSDVVQKVFRGGFFHLYGANLLILASGFGLQIFVAHLLPAETLGDVKVMQSYFSLLYVFGAMGMNISVLKVASEELPLEELNQVLKLSLMYSTVGVVICVTGVYAVNLTIGFSGSPSINRWIMIFVWSIPLIVYGQLGMAYMQARKRFKDLAKVNGLSKVVALILGVLLTWKFGVIGFISGLLSGYALTLCMYLRYIGLDWLGSSSSTVHAQRLRQLAFHVILANTINQMNTQIDLLMLDRLVTDRSMIGSYSLSVIFFTALMQFCGTIQMMMIPNLSALSDRIDEFLSSLRSYSLALLGGTLVLGLVAILAVPPFVTLVYGDKYAEFNELFVVQVFRFWAYAPGLLAASSFIALGRLDKNIIGSVIAFPFMAAATYILVGYYGVLGAGLAQVFGNLMISVIGLLFFWHYAVQARRASS